ncbi:hypothetical protein FN846DRAFT_892667 [Sphaerosporella brunnea]|uniref:Uncharacterized protein n=1 Tax=Sphaerosporella brunnea TaxID=1250544 RepID=A0A5J5EPS4_9PEZI|nr:hypothetical protein FN846DRAFT_892667 [Sphaerosporella brunnea]
MIPIPTPLAIPGYEVFFFICFLCFLARPATWIRWACIPKPPAQPTHKRELNPQLRKYREWMWGYLTHALLLPRRNPNTGEEFSDHGDIGDIDVSSDTFDDGGASDSSGSDSDRGRREVRGGNTVPPGWTRGRLIRQHLRNQQGVGKTLRMKQAAEKTKAAVEAKAAQKAKEAAEKARTEQRAKEAARKAEAEKQAREAAARAEAEEQAWEAAARAEAEEQALEVAARAEAEEQAREVAARAEAEKQEREAAEKAEAEKQAKEAAEKAEAEKQAKEAAEKAEAEKAKENAQWWTTLPGVITDFEMLSHAPSWWAATPPSEIITHQEHQDALDFLERMRKESPERSIYGDTGRRRPTVEDGSNSYLLSMNHEETYENGKRKKIYNFDDVPCQMHGAKSGEPLPSAQKNYVWNSTQIRELRGSGRWADDYALAQAVNAGWEQLF